MTKKRPSLGFLLTKILALEERIVELEKRCDELQEDIDAHEPRNVIPLPQAPNWAKPVPPMPPVPDWAKPPPDAA